MTIQEKMGREMLSIPDKPYMELSTFTAGDSDTCFPRYDPHLHTVVLDFEGVNFIDSQSVEKVAGFQDWATRHDIELHLTRIKTKVKDYLQRDSVIDHLGESRIYGNVYEAATDKIPAAPV